MKMKFFLYLVIITTLLIGCGGENKFDGDISFETVEVQKNGKEIDTDTTKSYEAKIKYYVVAEAPDYLKDSINRQTRIFLSNWFDVPEIGEYDIKKLINDDLHDFYKQVDELDDKDCFTCRIKQVSIDGEDVYQNKDLISFVYGWYVYEGGAHGNYGKICYNYEKITGKQITYKDIVKDEVRLLEIAQKAFKEQNGVNANEDISDIFQFENNKFYLNDNFRFMQDSIVFYYNPYEIAPYAAGLIEVAIPYEQLKGLINYIE